MASVQAELGVCEPLLVVAVRVGGAVFDGVRSDPLRDREAVLWIEEVERPRVDSHLDLVTLAHTGAWPKAADERRLARPFVGGERPVPERIICQLKRLLGHGVTRGDVEVDKHL